MTEIISGQGAIPAFSLQTRLSPALCTIPRSEEGMESSNCSTPLSSWRGVQWCGKTPRAFHRLGEENIFLCPTPSLQEQGAGSNGTKFHSQGSSWPRQEVGSTTLLLPCPCPSRPGGEGKSGTKPSANSPNWAVHSSGKRQGTGQMLKGREAARLLRLGTQV